MSDILQAARSYYGLADTDVRKTDIYTNDAGQPMLVFELALSAEDFIAIGDRMKNMQQPDTQPDTAIIEGPTVEAMREAYNALSKAEKGCYGSFARYMAESSDGIVDADPLGAEAFNRRYVELGGVLPDDHTNRQVIHVDAQEEPEPVSMDAVWLEITECTDAQKQLYSDMRHDPATGNLDYLIQWAMLTDEQKQKAKEAKP